MGQSAARAVDLGARIQVDHDVTFEDGHRGVVRSGTYVELDESDDKHAHVKFFATKKGRAARLPLWLLREEPKLAHVDSDDPEAPTAVEALDYERFSAPLWHGAPKIDDLKQGIIGDCYLLAALAAVVHSDPKVIMKMFATTMPNAAQYTITLYRRGRGAALQAHAVTVDTMLPSAATTFDEEKNQRGHGPRHLAYAGHGDRHPSVLWPGLIEKAYAQLAQGGYEAIGHGGSSATALEAITGIAAIDSSLPDTDDELYGLIKTLIGTYAFTAGSNEFKTHTGVKPQISHLSSEIEAVVNEEGSSVVFARNSVKIHAGALTLHDDGRGNLVDNENKHRGKVNYEHAHFKLDGDRSQYAPDEMRVDYGNKGWLDGDLQVYANHEYAITEVTKDRRVKLRNPWGEKDPHLLTMAQFRSLFDTLSIGRVHRDGE